MRQAELPACRHCRHFDMLSRVSTFN
eukprot:SAG11_NODE_29167_length_314_cov_0.469767_1_plen_25_part_10